MKLLLSEMGPGLQATLILAMFLAYRCAQAHAAVAAVSRSRLRAMADAGSQRADRLSTLLANRDELLGSLQCGSGVGIVVAAAVVWESARRVAVAGGDSLPVAAGGWLLAAGAMILAGRLTAAVRPESTALRLVGFVHTAYRVGGPLVRLLLGRHVVNRDDSEDDTTEESLLELVDQATLEPSRQRRIAEILEFPDRTAGDIMVPRIDLVTVAAEAKLAEVAEVMLETGYSRLPVYRVSKDDVVGLVHTRDVLAHLPKSDLTAADVMTSPLFISEESRLDQLLHELRTRHSSVAIVVDEFGGTAGLVSMEDLIEEIVGEIEDESDPGGELFRPRVDGGWIVSARCELSEISHLLEVEVEPDDDYSTIGGLVLHLAGDLPEPGEVVVKELPDALLVIQVIGVDGARLTELAVVVVPDRGPAPDGEAEEEFDEDVANRLLAGEPVSGCLPLGAVNRDPDEAHDGGVARLGDLFELWPAGSRQGRELVWRDWRLTVVDEDEQGRVRLRVVRLA